MKNHQISAQPVIKFKRLPHFPGQVPVYQTKGASGCDVHAAVEEAMTLKPGERAAIPTGMVLEIPEGYEIQVRPRSGLAFKYGFTLPNTPGTIDSDYRGELKILVANWGQEDFTVQRGDRIAQLVIMPVIQAVFMEADEVTETLRGDGGFGSTGIRAD